ncbi:MAG: ABC transporter permease [Alphaproteobacteria bacterium]|nr:ABC transporter permease [Alphaproteobacteria bacterium]
MDRKVSPLLIYAIGFVVFLYGPVLLMPLFSFNDGIFAVFPLNGFTLRHYASMAANTSMLAALTDSLVVATIVSVIATAIGLPTAIAFTRYKLPAGGAIAGLLMLPLVVPSIVFAVALLVILVRVVGIELSLWTVGAAHVFLSLPFSVMVLMARLEGFDRSLEEASRDLGENAWGTFRRVTLPLAWPGVISSLLMCFIISFDEFVMAFFLSGTEPTLPVFLFSQLRFPNKLPGVLALGSLILFASAILVVAAEMVRRRGVAPEKAWS